MANSDDAILIERFWNLAEERPNGCWHWTGAKNGNGYGAIWLRGKVAAQAHRFAHELLVGPIPAGKVIDHQCHNIDPNCSAGPCDHRACVNPDHLQVVEQRENLLNSPWTLNSASAAKTECPKGHPYDEANTRYDGTDRYCLTCKRAGEIARSAGRNAEKRERYRALRAAGLSSAEARSASKRKLVSHVVSVD